MPDVSNPPITTGRDLFKFVVAMLQRRTDSKLTLAQYLEALHGLLVKHAGESTVTGDAFAAMLDAAYEAEPEGPAPGGDGPGDAGFVRVSALLARQLADLETMRASGELENEHRYYGIDVPGSERWFNFDPRSYVECGAQGAFHGWMPGDESATGRSLVPGEVLVIGADGPTSVPAAEVVREPAAAARLGWDDLERFFVCGQTYE